MILGFGVDLLGFASAGALPFPGGIAIVTPHIDIQPPPNLPRRGGTDTIGHMIVIRLSIAVI